MTDQTASGLSDEQIEQIRACLKQKDFGILCDMACALLQKERWLPESVSGDIVPLCSRVPSEAESKLHGVSAALSLHIKEGFKLNVEGLLETINEVRKLLAASPAGEQGEPRTAQTIQTEIARLQMELHHLVAGDPRIAVSQNIATPQPQPASDELAPAKEK